MDDLNDEHSVRGVGRAPQNVRDGVRRNAAIAYLDAARTRPNLTIIDRSAADRLELAGGAVRGAFVIRDGARRLIPASLVVVAAGAYGSPAILLRSGIGPEADLRRLGIAPIVRLDGVGANLLNHWTARVLLDPGPEFGARIAAEANIILHSDGVQAVGKIPVSVTELGVSMYSISGHKIGAPKGVGVLYVRKGIVLKPMMYGGRHERERRGGTENVAGAVALGRAAEWISQHGDAENRRLAALRDRMEQSILNRIPDTRVNGAGAPRVANTTNVRFDGIDSDALLIALDLKGFAVSSGAAKDRRCVSSTARGSRSPR